jgi:hypothetical protein
MLIGIASGLLVVFLAWLAKTIFLSRRLFLIQPKLFDYSDLAHAHNSKTIELTAFNGGARSEEDIRIQLSPAFHYTIVASDAAGLTVDDQGILKIDRLAPKQDRTVILNAEGGEFRKDHVVGITSKEAVGKIKDKLQEAQLTPAQNALFAIVLFVLFPAFGYGAGKFIELELWPAIRPQVIEPEKISFTTENVEVNNASVPEADLEKYLGTFVIEKVQRRGDLVSVTTRLKNETDSKLEFSLFSSTPVSEKRGSGVDYIVVDVLVYPASEKEIVVTDYLPKDANPNLINLQVIVEGRAGRVDVHQDIVLNAN